MRAHALKLGAADWYRYLSSEMAMFVVLQFAIAALGVIPMAAHGVAEQSELANLCHSHGHGRGCGQSRWCNLFGRQQRLHSTARVTAGAVLKFAIGYALIDQFVTHCFSCLPLF